MELTALIEGGSTSIVYLAVAGLILGALHGLEPGHSKTMMAAFIIAVRGTVGHAVLLGTSAAISHTIIVWILAIIALQYGNEMIGEELEPYFIMVSGLIVLVVGTFMLFQIWHHERRSRSAAHGGHDHAHHHRHSHSHGGHDHGHTHDHMDAHALAHAREIETRFADGRATTWQTIGFGLTGGLIPCPAAITVLALCLHIGQFWLGVGMVASFSIGLALTLVMVGVAAALGVRYAAKRFSRIDGLFRKAPYVSSLLILVIGTYMAYSGWAHLPS